MVTGLDPGRSLKFSVKMEAAQNCRCVTVGPPFSFSGFIFIIKSPWLVYKTILSNTLNSYLYLSNFSSAVQVNLMFR